MTAFSHEFLLSHRPRPAVSYLCRIQAPVRTISEMLMTIFENGSMEISAARAIRNQNLQKSANVIFMRFRQRSLPGLFSVWF